MRQLVSDNTVTFILSSEETKKLSRVAQYRGVSIQTQMIDAIEVLYDAYLEATNGKR